MAFDHYGKEWGQHYQEPLWAALGVPPPPRDEPPPAEDAGHKGAGRKARGQD